MANGKKSNPIGLILIILVILLVIPGAILTGFYFVSDAFKFEANKILSQVPGPVGTYFKAYPTREELGLQIQAVAEYMLSSELERAADKLELIQKDDPNMYDEVIKSMIRLNPNRTEQVLEVLRKRSLKSNVIASTMDEITKEVDQNYMDRAEALKKMSLTMRLGEIKRIIDQEVDSYMMAANILKNLDDRDAIDILKRLDAKDKNAIMDYLPEEKRLAWMDLLNQEQMRIEALDLVVTLMKKDTPQKNAELLGPNSTHTLEEKAYIFSQLDPEAAGKILSYINDPVMTSDLIQKIKETQLIDNGEDKITDDILKSLKIFTEYDDNIKELVNIYNGISDVRAAAMLKELYWKSSTFKSFTLSNNKSIIISSSDVALDVLRQFSNKKIAAILSLYDDQLATEISTQLALPKE